MPTSNEAVRFQQLLTTTGITPDSDEYDEINSTAIELLMQAGHIDPAGLDAVGDEISDTLQTRLIELMIRSPRLRVWFEVAVEADKTSSPTDVGWQRSRLWAITESEDYKLVVEALDHQHRLMVGGSVTAAQEYRATLADMVERGWPVPARHQS